MGVGVGAGVELGFTIGTDIGSEDGDEVGVGLGVPVISLMVLVIAAVIGLLGSEAIAKITLVCMRIAVPIKNKIRLENNAFNFIVR